MAGRHAAALALGLLVATPNLVACGKARELERGEELRPVVLGGGGERNKRGKAAGFGALHPVTNVVAGASGLPDWTASDLPFTGPAVAIGQNVPDTQTPFRFEFDYPDNNFQLANAHLVVDTSRDNSDTEGIMVEGVFTGRPPLSLVNSSAGRVTDALYFGSPAATPNTYFIDWALSHYKRNTRNTFDLALADLFTGSATTVAAALADGYLPVVTGDDSPVYQAYLVINGVTASKSPLACAMSPAYTFQNVYLHDDGNSVGRPAFTGSVGHPVTSWGQAVGTFGSVEFFYDAPLPKVDVANVTLTAASLAFKVKRAASGEAALVVNGLGVSQAGFDRALATSVAEQWDDSAGAASAFSAFLAGIPANGTEQTVTLNLLALLGETNTRMLLSQGKLNVAFAGSLSTVHGQAATSTRGFGVAVGGPELSLAGTYATPICQVPDDPSSPLKETGLEVRTENDNTSPVISSVQITDLTSRSATISWLTDEPATRQVAYGIGGLTARTAKSEDAKTFHEVRLTGLTPYKYYSYQVASADQWGNESKSTITVFLTLR